MARRTILGGKIHQAMVTETRLDYEGSITIDSALMDAVGLREFELVHVWNLANGLRFETYAVPGKAGEVMVNGAAARLAAVGDRIIIAHFVGLDEKELPDHAPRIIRVDEHNRPLPLEPAAKKGKR